MNAFIYYWLHCFDCFDRGLIFPVCICMYGVAPFDTYMYILIPEKIRVPSTDVYLLVNFDRLIEIYPVHCYISACIDTWLHRYKSVYTRVLQRWDIWTLCYFEEMIVMELIKCLIVVCADLMDRRQLCRDQCARVVQGKVVWSVWELQQFSPRWHEDQVGTYCQFRGSLW